ncbi:MAG: FAD binding domain-containing protein [Candidatus Sericytochromatia bacterium]
MDLNTVTSVVRRPHDRPGEQWRPGDAWLAGGTWLFSEPQPDVDRLIDLTALNWPALEPSGDGLRIGSTCTIRELYEFVPPHHWPAATLFATCCEAFLASFKVWNCATVGGNICMSLPAGPMITLTVALDATYLLWGADGAERWLAAGDFVTGNHRNMLADGEILRSIHIPAGALRKRHAHRRFSLTRLGRSTVFLIGTAAAGERGMTLTLTASTTRPVQLSFDDAPDAATMRDAIAAIPTDVWFDDANGSPQHRRHLTGHFAEEIRAELVEGGSR